MDPNVLAEKLGRSRHAINQVKSRIRRGGRSDEVDFDTRPSGWYEETIGILMLDFPDVMATWRHYHQYIEVHYVQSDVLGWVSVRCYRDAGPHPLTEKEFLELPYS